MAGQRACPAGRQSRSTTLSTTLRRVFSRQPADQSSWKGFHYFWLDSVGLGWTPPDSPGDMEPSFLPQMDR
jgi:hypothetical protein